MRICLPSVCGLILGLLVHQPNGTAQESIPPFPTIADVPPASAELSTSTSGAKLPPMIAAAKQPTEEETSSSSLPTLTTEVPTPSDGTYPTIVKADVSKPGEPPKPFKNCYFDNDFSYKSDPNHTAVFGENFKNVPLRPLFGCEALSDTQLSVGGEVRWRYMDERNRLRSPFPTPKGNTYDLVRTRNYLDLKHSDWVRVYIEMIDAESYFNDLPVQGSDRNTWDILNAFVDLKILERDDKPVWLRTGRQELLFGSQRLISTNDWANNRRNFEGLRINSPGTSWDLDAWLTHPVNTTTFGDGNGSGPGLGVFQAANQLDAANRDVTFGGLWAAYKGIKDHTIHSFFLWDHYQSAFPGGAGFPLGDRYTYGHNWQGKFNVAGGDRAWLTDIEGGYQFGTDHGVDVRAGYFTGGVGHSWKTLPMEPTLWGYFDYASGDNNKNDKVNSTFFQNYGWTHNYLGLIDNIGRQNIMDWNYKLQIKPTKKTQASVQQHLFQLANANDSVYVTSGQKIGSPGHGTDVGNEIDIVGTYYHSPNLSFDAGFMFFQYGKYVEAVSPRANAQTIYLMTTFKY